MTSFVVVSCDYWYWTSGQTLKDGAPTSYPSPTLKNSYYVQSLLTGAQYNSLKFSLRSKRGEYGDQDERSEVSEPQRGSSFQHTQTSLSSFATHGRL